MVKIRLTFSSNSKKLLQVLQSNNSGEIELKVPPIGWQGITLTENVIRGLLPLSRPLADWVPWWGSLAIAVSEANKSMQRKAFSELIQLQVCGVTAGCSSFQILKKTPGHTSHTFCN